MRDPVRWQFRGQNLYYMVREQHLGPVGLQRIREELILGDEVYQRFAISDDVYPWAYYLGRVIQVDDTVYTVEFYYDSETSVLRWDAAQERYFMDGDPPRNIPLFVFRAENENDELPVPPMQTGLRPLRF